MIYFRSDDFSSDFYAVPCNKTAQVVQTTWVDSLKRLDELTDTKLLKLPTLQTWTSGLLAVISVFSFKTSNAIPPAS